MIEIRMPLEIREYKEKLWFGFTTRQFLSTLAALLICVPLYYFGRPYIDDDVLSWIIIFIAAPLVLTGFFKFNQMNFEEFVKVTMAFYWNKQNRPYQYTPLFESIRNIIITEQLKEAKKQAKIKAKTKKEFEKKTL